MKINSRQKIIAVTGGDPAGIGTEIIEKCAKIYTPLYPVVVFGDRERFDSVSFENLNEFSKIRDKKYYLFHVDRAKKDSSFAYVEEAAKFALDGKVSAIVTAPVNKSKWIRAGHNFMGHTDYFVKLTAAKKSVMFFWSNEIKTALFTTHIPLSEAIGKLNRNDLVSHCRFVNSELKRITKKSFSFLVSGLNPHAGEEGTLGREEIRIISPAIDELKSEMIIDGPFPPDTVFLKALNTPDSVVISLYHDQGLIPFKLLKINAGVNVTLGLPFIRTSPDHGTAYDIAGKGVADPGSMVESLKLAEYFIKNKKN